MASPINPHTFLDNIESHKNEAEPSLAQMTKLKNEQKGVGINKTTLEHLARLANIELDPKEEEKLLKDLIEIIDYFKELESLDTKSIMPMTGGTDLVNIFRNDDERENTDRGTGTEIFPEKKNGFLKVPPVFN